jgi:DNA invertase Pin-like site-specific DNA recombinase
VARYAYMRVSTGMQDHQSQKHVLKKAYKGYDEWYEDTGTGRKTQPNLKLLLARCKKGDVIVISAFDRLGRNTKEVISIADKLKQRGVTLVSIKEKVDLNSPAGNMLFQAMCMVAEFESSHTAERIKSGLMAAKERGVEFGRPLHSLDKDWKKAMVYAKRLRKKETPYREIQTRLYENRGIHMSIGTLHRYLVEI